MQQQRQGIEATTGHAPNLLSSWQIVRLDDERGLYAYNRRAGQYVELSATQVEVLKLLDGNHSPQAIVERIPGIRPQDVLEFIQKLSALESMPNGRRRHGFTGALLEYRLPDPVVRRLSSLPWPSLKWLLVLLPLAGIGYWLLLAELQSGDGFIHPFQLSSLVWVIVGLPIGSVCHEIGHIWFARRYGIDILGIGMTTTFGVVPSFYCDLLDEPDDDRVGTVRWLLIDVSGVLTQLMIGGVLAFGSVAFLHNFPRLAQLLLAWAAVNAVMGGINLLPIPPLDGHKALDRLWLTPQTRRGTS